MKNEHETVRAISVDFDGVIHRYSLGWHDDTIYDPPMPGAREALAEMLKYHSVFIMSARPAAQILLWCTRHFPEIEFALVPQDTRYWDVRGVVGITNRKLPALCYIDDRAIRFTNWQDVLNYVR